jgi:photosystem II stability/assembly factor-like uncharacterized protein
MFFMSKRILFITLFAAVFLGGCTVSPLTGKEGKNASVVKSFTRGESFEPKGLVATASGKTATINNFDAVDLVFDPMDSQTLYLGTRSGGLYISFDGGDSWQVTKINQGAVEAIAIDPKDRCNVYALMASRIIKSADCARNFEVIYFEPRNKVRLTSLVVDIYNPSILYAGNSVGDLIQSQNGGKSWSVLKRFSSSLKKIILSPRDTRVIYVATGYEGIFMSLNQGETWESWREALREFPGSSSFVDLIESPENPNHLILASRYGLLKTSDQGGRFENIPILTRPEEIPLYSVAFNPQDEREIFYTDTANFYYSKDGGATWTTRKLPVLTKVAVKMLVDPFSPNVIYLGLAKIK